MRSAMDKTHAHPAAVVALGVVLLASAAEVVAQPLRHGFLSGSAGLQASSTDFTEDFTFTSNAEEAGATAVYGVDTGFIFDVSGGVFVWQNFAVGAAVSRFSKDAEAAVSGRLPNPFFFNEDRLVDGVAKASRTETAVHVQALWAIPVSRNVEVGVFGGPSIFRVDQDLARAIEFIDEFPFNTATFVSASMEPRSESAVGFHVGADVAVFVTPHVGVGGLVRFSRATIAFAGAGAGSLSVDAGGLHLGGGVRLRF